MWKRKTTTDGYPSVGTLSTHHRVPRVIMWSVHGFHGKLTDLPNVWHHCKKKLCVNPDHLRLITEYLALVDPMLRNPRLAQIEKLDGAIESFALGSPRHVV